MGKVVPLITCQQAGDCCQAPVSIGLVEISSEDPLIIESSAQRFKPMLVSDRQENEGGMLVEATILLRILESGMARLYGLVRRGNVSAGNTVQECLVGNLGLHNILTC